MILILANYLIRKHLDCFFSPQFLSLLLSEYFSLALPSVDEEDPTETNTTMNRERKQALVLSASRWITPQARSEFNRMP